VQCGVEGGYNRDHLKACQWVGGRGGCDCVKKVVGVLE